MANTVKSWVLALHGIQHVTTYYEENAKTTQKLLDRYIIADREKKYRSCLFGLISYSFARVET